MADTEKVTITWRGRKITIKRPGTMQLATWERTARRASEIGKGDGALSEDESKEMANLLSRLLRIVLSLFSDNADREWLEDLLLDGDVTDEDILGMFSDATDGFADGSTRKTSASKATRRA